MDDFFLFLGVFGIYAFIFGWGTGVIARDKGYPFAGWFFAGLCFNLLAMIVAACLPALARR